MSIGNRIDQSIRVYLNNGTLYRMKKNELQIEAITWHNAEWKKSETKN